MSNVTLFSSANVPAFARNNELSETAKALTGGNVSTGRDVVVKFAGCYHGHVDSLLVAASGAAITELHTNTNLIAEDTSHIRRFRRKRAPIAVGTLIGVIALGAFSSLPVALLARLLFGSKHAV